MAAASLSLPSLGVFCDSLKGVKSGTKKYEKGSNDPQTSPARPSPAELKTARQTRERFQGCIVMKSMLSSLKFQVAGRCAFSRSPRQIVSSPGLSRLLMTTGQYRFIEVAAEEGVKKTAGPWAEGTICFLKQTYRSPSYRERSNAAT